MTRKSIYDVAEAMIESVGSGTPPEAAEAFRLACFILDHGDHRDFDKPVAPTVEAIGSHLPARGGPGIDMPDTELQRRLQSAKPGQVTYATQDQVKDATYSNATDAASRAQGQSDTLTTAETSDQPQRTTDDGSQHDKD